MSVRQTDIIDDLVTPSTRQVYCYVSTDANEAEALLNHSQQFYTKGKGCHISISRATGEALRFSDIAYTHKYSDDIQEPQIVKEIRPFPVNSQIIIPLDDLQSTTDMRAVLRALRAADENLLFMNDSLTRMYIHQSGSYRPRHTLQLFLPDGEKVIKVN